MPPELYYFMFWVYPDNRIVPDSEASINLSEVNLIGSAFVLSDRGNLVISVLKGEHYMPILDVLLAIYITSLFVLNPKFDRSSSQAYNLTLFLAVLQCTYHLIQCR